MGLTAACHALSQGHADSRKSARILLNPSTVEQVEYWRKQKSRNIYTQHTKKK